MNLATGAPEKLFEANSWFWGAAVTDGTMLYIPNMDGNVYAYNIESGRVVWAYPGNDEGEPVLASPVLSGDELVYASDSGIMVVLDAQSGSRNGTAAWGMTYARRSPLRDGSSSCTRWTRRSRR